MKTLATLVITLVIGCSAAKYVSQRTEKNVEFSYKWNHPVGAPSELLVRLTNNNGTMAHVQAEFDLNYQGFRVESFEVDTCIKASHTMQGKLNGIYFIPTKVTTEQIKSGDAEIELIKFEVNTDDVGMDCP